MFWTVLQGSKALFVTSGKSNTISEALPAYGLPAIPIDVAATCSDGWSTTT